MSEKRRILSVVVLIFGLTLALGGRAGADSTPPPSTSVDVSASANAYAIVRAMNAVRAAYGVRPLRPGRALMRAARAHSTDMARRGYFDHGDFVRRLRRFGVRLPYVGENLAYGSGGMGAGDVVKMWIASPPHRQNLLDPGFQRVGVGMAVGSRMLITADFGGR